MYYSIQLGFHTCVGILNEKNIAAGGRVHLEQGGVVDADCAQSDPCSTQNEK